LGQQTLDRQKDMMQKHNLGALVTMAPENIGYVTGVIVPSQTTVRSRHAICITPFDQNPVVVVVNIEELLVRNNSWIDSNRIFSYNEFTQDPIALAAQKIEELGLRGKRIGIELNYLPAKDYATLTKLLPDVEWVNAEEMFASMRELKFQSEIAAIEKFGHQAEDIIYHAFDQVHAGMTEYDLANYLVNGFYASGGEKLTMLVVTSGERSSFLNGAATDRKLVAGDMIRVDLIGTKKGYYCDVCRTAVVGDPSPEQLSTWQKLVKSHDDIVAQIKPGHSTQNIYNNFRKQFLDWGLTPVDFVGHGLGLTLHEEPYIGRYSDTELKENMVLCVEPIYIIPNVCGYQLENEVIVTAEGCRVITNKHDYHHLPVIKK
jgi:Xaa-Pro dipeptidase